MTVTPSPGTNEKWRLVEEGILLKKNGFNGGGRRNALSQKGVGEAGHVLEGAGDEWTFFPFGGG